MCSQERVEKIVGHLSGGGAQTLRMCPSSATVAYPKGSKFDSSAMFRLDGRVAIVTGGSRGMGSQFARALASVGASIVITSRSQADVDETAALVREETGGKCIGIAGDVSDENSCNEVVARTIQEFGGIDILVNNAGISYLPEALADLSTEKVNKIFDINLKGPIFMSRAAAPALMKSGRGRIINISSVAALTAIPGRLAYCASKAGLDSVTKSLAKELGEHKITVNSINAGAFRTKMLIQELPEGLTFEDLLKGAGLQIPINRVGDLKELAAQVILLSSDLGAYTTGACISIDGGMSL